MVRLVIDSFCRPGTTLSLRMVCVFFFALAFVLFFPFFGFSRIFIANTDSLTAGFPMMLFGWEAMHLGKLNAWNPYVNAGVSNFAFAGFMPASVDLWLPVALPRAWLFDGLTFVQYVKMALVGVFAWQFTRREIGDDRWGLFAATIYMLCGYTIFAATAYEALMTLLLFTISLSLVWGAEERHPAKTYAGLALCMGISLASGHISYAAYSMIGTGLGVLYRAAVIGGKDWRRALRFLALFSAASLTALGLAAFRLLPTLAEVQAVGVGCCRPSFLETPFILLRLFVPEIFGVFYQSSAEYFTTMAPFYNGWHIQWVIPQYFGAVATILVICGMVWTKTAPERVWAGVTVFVLGVAAFIVPFITIAEIAFFPVFHTLSFQIFLLPAFCVTAGLAGLRLERTVGTGGLTQSESSRILFIFYVVWAFLVSFLFDYWGAHVPGVVLRRLVLLGLLGLPLVAGAWFRLRERQAMGVVLPLVLVAAIICSGLAVFMAVKARILGNYGEFFLDLSLSLAILLGILAAMMARLLDRDSLSHRLGRLLPAALVVVVVGVALPWTSELIQIHRGQDVLLAIGGTLRLAIVLGIVLLLLKLGRMGKATATTIFPLLFLVMIFELVPAWRIHSHLVVNPFFAGDPFPPLERTHAAALVDAQGNPVHPDYRNYRVNRSAVMLQLPFYLKHWGETEIASSISAGYAIRSYGGYWNMMSAEYFRFLGAFIKDSNEYGMRGAYNRQTEPRFLDLVGVRYDYDSVAKVVVERPGAVSRIMLYRTFSVEPDESKALNKLHLETFRPLAETVLSEDPGVITTDGGGDAIALTNDEAGTDRITVAIPNGESGVVVINDQFHVGWSAVVDGRSAKIMRANSVFMAVAVPAGSHALTLMFEPPRLALGLRISTAALAAMVAVLGLLVGFSARRRMGGVK